MVIDSKEVIESKVIDFCQELLKQLVLAQITLTKLSRHVSCWERFSKAKQFSGFGKVSLIDPEFDLTLSIKLKIETSRKGSAQMDSFLGTIKETADKFGSRAVSGLRGYSQIAHLFEKWRKNSGDKKLLQQLVNFFLYRMDIKKGSSVIKDLLMNMKRNFEEKENLMFVNQISKMFDQAIKNHSSIKEHCKKQLASTHKLSYVLIDSNKVHLADLAFEEHIA
jgi:hypothetical protein